MRRSKGMAMVATLLLCAVVMVAALTIAAVGNSQLMLAQKLCAERAAAYQADGLVRLAAAELAASPKWAPNLLTWPLAAPDPQHCAELTFAGTQLGVQGQILPYSTNNLDGQHSQGYNNVPVASGTVQIIAVGHCGPITRTVQAVLKVPTFPFVICGDGPATLPTLNVQGAPSMGAYTGGSTSLPADIGVNGALTLNGATISGDVVYGGALDLIGNVSVGGKFCQSQVTVPQIETVNQLEAGIPAAADTPPPAADKNGNLSLDSNYVYHARGGLTITGNLTMSDSELFVDGPLVVKGGISGLGGVFVNGSIQVGGISNLNAANNVALIAEGSVTLSGGTGTGTSNFFQGLVYSRDGTIEASNITVVGAMMNAQGPAGNPLGITLDPASALAYVPSVLSVNLQTVPQDSYWATIYDGNFTSGTDPGPQYPKSLREDMVPYSVQVIGHKSRFGTPQEDAATSNLTQAYADWQAANAPPGLQLLLSWQKDPYASPCSYWIPGLQGGSMLLIDGIHFNAQTQQMEMHQPPQISIFTGDDPTTGTPVTWAQFDQFAHTQGSTADAMVDGALAAMTAYMNLVNAAIMAFPNGPPPIPPPPYPIHINLNNFLSNSMPIQIVNWGSN